MIEAGASITATARLLGHLFAELAMGMPAAEVAWEHPGRTGPARSAVDAVQLPDGA